MNADKPRWNTFSMTVGSYVAISGKPQPPERRTFEVVELNEVRSLEKRIIEYCEPHLDMMWAATVIGELLSCDFRECKDAISKWREESVK